MNQFNEAMLKIYESTVVAAVARMSADDAAEEGKRAVALFVEQVERGDFGREFKELALPAVSATLEEALAEPEWHTFYFESALTFRSHLMPMTVYDAYREDTTGTIVDFTRVAGAPRKRHGKEA